MIPLNLLAFIYGFPLQVECGAKHLMLLFFFFFFYCISVAGRVGQPGSLAGHLISDIQRNNFFGLPVGQEGKIHCDKCGASRGCVSAGASATAWHCSSPSVCLGPPRSRPLFSAQLPDGLKGLSTPTHGLFYCQWDWCNNQQDEAKVTKGQKTKERNLCSEWRREDVPVLLVFVIV